MSDNDDNFGGTKLVAENGDHLDPAMAGMSPPTNPTTRGEAAGAATTADLEDDDAGEAEMKALSDEDATDASPTEGGDAADESEAQPS
ncbi:hypothetical protein [Sphingomonas rubra]|uniref:Uncharacterized protein n=1 Tax=Sphingomonas rubra TaxID=634430 RepID=A0A1I5SFN9_9SPHN|nr:hypothetical protein [Sphingomonas rubra]SFP69535.1 hypothetical protein SAMN04488241_105200 [Sphingomonas rubra]